MQGDAARGKCLGFVIVTHGKIGKELLGVANHIMGSKLKGVRVVQVPFTGDMVKEAFPNSERPYEEWHRWIARGVTKEIRTVNQGQGVILLTDIRGGTAFNICKELVKADSGLVISGINLPMLLKIPSVCALPLNQAGDILVDRSRKAIELRVP